MMEENYDIFLAGNDSLVYLAKPMYKKYSTTFFLGYPFSTYISYDRFFNLLPLFAPVHIFDYPPPCPWLHTYLMDDHILNQKTNKNIRISYLLK